jgi:hypothetical protein
MAVRPITTSARLRRLTRRQRRTFTKTLQAERLNRELGWSLERSAREAGTTPETVRAYQGDVWDKHDGRWVRRPGGRLKRSVRVVTTSGPRSFVVGEQDARIARAYRDALWRYINFDDDRGLADLEGRSIQGYRLETDPGELDVMIGSGELDIAEIGSGDVDP